MSTSSRLNDTLAGGGFAILAVAPAVCGVDLSPVKTFAASVKGKVTAVIAPDNAGATVSASALAVSRTLLYADVEPVMCMATRDRNRMALCADLLGAGALGIVNIFVTNGVHPNIGSMPQAMRVYDVDAVLMLAIANKIMAEKALPNGEAVTGEPNFFLGASANPFVKSAELHLSVLKKKAAAGAKYLITSPVYDVPAFSAWMDGMKKAGIADKCAIIAGVPLSREKFGDDAVARCRETIAAVKNVPGCRGVAIMAPGCEEMIQQVL